MIDLYSELERKRGEGKKKGEKKNNNLLQVKHFDQWCSMPVLIKVFLDSCLVACFDDVLLECQYHVRLWEKNSGLIRVEQETYI